ncbi:predicted GPI-anchored protein 58 [Drosophila guanche]|uniref:predicted GPI-anchored protein 58 n=1 Tax=Drosophila guanche TaxID=7266 RepID=UPI001471A0AE|nr:predicted GPI-anchored protein 58 [Drosophila guanche]
MQTKQIAVWIALTILLHCSEAQEDNILEQTSSMEAATTPSVPTEVKPSEMEQPNDKNSTGSESGDAKSEESSMGTDHVDLGPQIEEKPPMDTEDIPAKEEEKEKEKEEPSDNPPAVEHTEPPMEAAEIPAHPKPLDMETETENTDKDKPPAETESIPDAPAEDYQDDAPHEDTTAAPPAGTQPPTPPTPPTVPQFPTISCYSCGNCKEKPTNKTKCTSTAGKRNGCVTLVKSEEKLVLRGCISELAESGNNYCISNAKGCEMCYENDCNAKAVTLSNAAAAPLLGSWLFIISCLLAM